MGFVAAQFAATAGVWVGSTSGTISPHSVALRTHKGRANLNVIGAVTEAARRTGAVKTERRVNQVARPETSPIKAESRVVSILMF